MTDRDEKILSHIGLYRLTFRRVLEHVFFEGRNAGNVIQRLVDAGRMQVRTGMPERVSYYQLTPAEAQARQVPIARARPLRAQAIQQHMSVLWFCTMAGVPRFRLEMADLHQLIPGIPDSPQAAYCLEGTETPRIYRVEVAGPDANTRAVVQRVTARIHEAAKQPGLGEWLRTRQFGFVILADSEKRREQIHRQVEDKELQKDAHVIIDYAPSHRTISLALRQHANSRSPETRG